jgi:hypothetical protein
MTVSLHQTKVKKARALKKVDKEKENVQIEEKYPEEVASRV